MPNIDYGRDLLKHAVRTKLWLPACSAQRQSIRRHMASAPLKYFTFCAAEAIDVFMLERAHILSRSAKTERLEGVYFCENNELDFGRIASLIGSPTQGFLGDFDKIVLFEDDEDTTGKTLYGENEEDFSEEVRKKLKHKDAHKRLEDAFPFDIINLDVFGVMFPPKGHVIAPLLASILKILSWQSDKPKCERFTLFLTSHVESKKMNQEAISQLEKRLADNIENVAEFKLKFNEVYKHIDAQRLSNENFAEFFSLAIPKFFIHHALFDLGWQVEYGPTYLYNRPDKYTGDDYQMMHSAAVFKRIPNFRKGLDGPLPGQYSKSVTRLISTTPTWVNVNEGSDEATQLLQDLDEIVAFRDSLLA